MDWPAALNSICLALFALAGTIVTALDRRATRRATVERAHIDAQNVTLGEQNAQIRAALTPPLIVAAAPDHVDLVKRPDPAAFPAVEAFTAG